MLVSLGSTSFSDGWRFFPLPLQIKITMGIAALKKNDNFDGPNYLVTPTKMGSSINFGQKIVNH